MNRTNTGMVISLTLLLACQSHTEKLICAFEQTSNRIEIIEIIHQEYMRPFVASDSIKLLEHLYDSLLQQKRTHLQQQWETTQARWLKASGDLKTIENPIMRKAFTHQINLIDEERKKLEIIMAIYENAPEKTQLNTYLLKKQAYVNHPDSVLGYSQVVGFLGKQGALPEKTFQKTYLFSRDKQVVLGILKP